jgi:hypothetical protein
LTVGLPADDSENARLIISPMIIEALEALKLRYPKTTGERRRKAAGNRQGALPAGDRSFDRIRAAHSIPLFRSRDCAPRSEKVPQNYHDMILISDLNEGMR